MGIAACIFSALALATSAYINKKNKTKLLSFSTAFYCVWFFVLFFSNLKLYDIDAASSEAYLYIFLMLVSYFVGFIIYTFIYQKNQTKDISFKKEFIAEEKFSVKELVFYGLCIVSFVFFIIDIILIIKQIRLGVEIWQIHNWTLAPYNSLNPINSRRSMLEIVLRRCLTDPFSFIIYPIATFYFFDFKKPVKKRVFMLSAATLFLVLSSLAALGGRLVIVYFFICLMISFFIALRNGSIPQQKRKIYLYSIIGIVSFGILLFVAYTAVRTSFSQIFKQIYTYIALPPTLLTKWLNSAKAANNTFGLLSFFGIHTYIFRGLKIIGLGALVPQAYLTSYDWILNAEVFLPVGYGRANAFVTPIFYFIVDGGVPFICIASLFFGFLLTLILNKISQRQNLRNLIIYVLVLYAIALSFIRIQTASPAYVIAFIMLILLLKKKTTLEESFKLVSFEEKISVVVPIYKVEDCMRKCVDSILAQTYTNIEVLLVDDGSPDKCGEICEEYAKKDKRIKVIHKKNGGLSDARNTGINVASGSYIAFVDSDDYLDSQYLEILYMALIANNADLSICSHKVILKGKTIDKSTGEYFTSSPEIILKKLMYDNGVDLSAWAKLYKKELFNTIKYPTGRLYEDAATTYLLIDKSNRIAVCSMPLYNYVIRNSSISQCEFSEKKMDLIVSTKEMTDYVASKYPKLKKSCERRLLYSYFSTLTQYTKSNNKNPEIEKKLLGYIRKNSLPVFFNIKTPLRDKAAVIASLFGIKFYRKVWTIFNGR